MAQLFTAVQSTSVLVSTYLAALPARLGTVYFLGFVPAETLLLAPALAWWALIVRVAYFATLVNPAVALLFTRFKARPVFLRTADGFLRRLATFARNADCLRARWAWPGVAKQHAAMPTVGYQPFPTGLPTGMRYQPEMILRALLLSTEALVMPRYIHRFVLLATLWAIPVDGKGRLRNVLTPVVVVAFLKFVTDTFLGNAIICPPLDAQ